MTKEEKVAAISKLFDEYKDQARAVGREVEIDEEPGGLRVRVTQMYECVDVSFEKLRALSEMFGTDKIDVNNGSWSYGCESCDWGSEYEVIINVKGPTR